MPGKIIDQISVFFPAYNEENNIVYTIKKAQKVLKQIAKKYEILVIDDGSEDNTVKKVQKMIENDRNIRLVKHGVNRGYSAALATGYYNSKYEWISYTDSDGQHDFSEIDKFIAVQKKSGADIVYSYYKDRKVSFIRKINSLLWSLIVRASFGVKAKDIGCAFKLVNRKVLEEIPKLESERGNFGCTEFLVKARKKGFKMIEVPITHFPRRSGEATASTNLSNIIASFKSLFKLRKKIS